MFSLVLNFFRKRFQSERIRIFLWENHVYLFVQDKNPKSYLTSKSKNGFDFDTCSYNNQLFQSCLKSEKEDKKINQRYSSFINLQKQDSSLAIQGSFTILDKTYLFYHIKNKKNNFEVRALVFDKDKPTKLIKEIKEPIWETEDDWRNSKVIFLKLLKIQNHLISYWYIKNRGIFAICYPEYKLTEKIKVKGRLKVSKAKQNPLISPKSNNSWEAFTTFNPAAVYEADKVHILYRAQGFDYLSSIGYASSDDGININQRLDKPIFKPSQIYETNTTGKANKNFISAGGYGGCEDPRITKIDNRIYMIYVAFDGQNPPRLALTSILVTDFLAKKWLWSKPVLISPPGVVDKSGCLLPEKINGKYVIFHRIYPNILIDFVNDLNFDGTWFLKGEYKITPRSSKWWDSRKIGAGAPPIKTEDGWLLIYQAVDDKNASEYKVGAMLLDLENPTKVLYRSKHPILEPRECYENEGFKAGVVYPCGAVVLKERLFIYYGAADSYVCLASKNLKSFLQSLKTNQVTALEPTLIKKID